MAAILVVFGASGAGKTAALRALAAARLPGVRCLHFDDVGVPSLDEMSRDHGGPDTWQAAATARWIERLLAEPAEIAVLEGQTRPSFVRAALERAEGAEGAVARMVLLDCAPAERARRLAGPRGQPELATDRMDAWAAYLRGQADALDIPVVDTTARTVDAVAAELAVEVERLRAASRR
jgi:hypothetical protein